MSCYGDVSELYPLLFNLYFTFWNNVVFLDRLIDETKQSMIKYLIDLS